ncbi:MAG: TIGR04086 family membrane protein [Clostridia bacterium]|nr:TIGR04086 family membrane protein [Clostridia bacterium]
MHKKRRTKTKVKDSSLKNIAKKTAIGSVASLLSFFALTALAALILWKNDSDTASFKYIVSAIGAVSGFLGGFIAVRPVRKNGIAFGTLSALVPCVLILAVSALLTKSPISIAGWIFIAVNILFSAIGGIVAVNKRK